MSVAKNALHAIELFVLFLSSKRKSETVVLYSHLNYFFEIGEASFSPSPVVSILFVATKKDNE